MQIKVEVRVSSPFENDDLRSFFCWASSQSINNVVHRLKDALSEYDNSPPEDPDGL